MEKEKFKEDTILKAYNNAQEMIKLADSKANLSITIQSLLVTIGLGTSLISDSFNTLWTSRKILFWLYFTFVLVFVIISMFGLVFSTLVYKARFSPEKGEESRQGTLYHRHIASYKTSANFKEKLEKLKKKEYLEDYTIQAFNVAKIANEKMKFVNTSIWFLFTNIALTVLLMVFNGLILII